MTASGVSRAAGRHLWWIAGLMVSILVYFYITDEAVIQDNQYRLTLAIAFAPVVATVIGLFLWKPKAKLPWVFYGLAWLMAALGDFVVQFFTETKSIPPIPSDALWIQFAPYMTLALILFAWQRARVRHLTLGLASAVVGLSVAALTYVPTFELLLANKDLALDYKLVLIGYNVGSIALLLVAVRLGFSHGHISFAYLLLLGIVVVQAFTAFTNLELNFLWADAKDPTLTPEFLWLTLIPRMSVYVLGTMIPLHWSMTVLGSSPGKEHDTFTPKREVLIAGSLVFAFIGMLLDEGSTSVFIAGVLALVLLIARYFIGITQLRRQADQRLQMVQELLNSSTSHGPV